MIAFKSNHIWEFCPICDIIRNVGFQPADPLALLPPERDMPWHMVLLEYRKMSCFVTL